MHMRLPILARVAAALALAGCGAAASPPPGPATGAVAGVVRFEHGPPEPRPGVRVRVAGTAAEARTDSAGRYALPRVPAGRRTLEFRAVGLVPVDTAVRVPRGGSVRVDLTMASAVRPGL
jgi:hypothetical protein